MSVAPFLPEAAAYVTADMPELEYRRHPSLSSTGARRLMKCPALYRHEADHGRPEKKAFDFGHAAHGLVLGVGQPVAVVKADSWRTNAAKEQRSAAYATGAVPLLAADWAQVQAMAAALRASVAGPLFAQPSGRPEVSGFWVDSETGVPCRFRADWMFSTTAGRLVIVDYKSTDDAEPGHFARSAGRFGYHQQHPWYVDGATACGLGDDPAFVFVAQEKDPPYLVTVGQLSDEDVELGRRLNQRARERFRDCTESGVWPGYSTEIVTLRLPKYMHYDTED